MARSTSQGDGNGLGCDVDGLGWIYILVVKNLKKNNVEDNTIVVLVEKVEGFLGLGDLVIRQLIRHYRENSNPNETGRRRRR